MQTGAALGLTRWLVGGGVFCGWGGLRLGHLFGEVICKAGSMDGVMVVYRSADVEQHSEEDQLSASNYARVELELCDEALGRL